MQKIGIVLVSLALGACSSLDANSDFIDAVESVKDRRNFVEVIAKSYSPKFNTVNGADVMKSAVVLTGNFPKSQERVPASNMYFEVTYFQTHDEYTKVAFDGETYPLKAFKENFQNCNEHCTTTQYFHFPIEVSDIVEASEQGLDFTLISSSKSMVTEFEVPAGYFNAVLEEAERYTKAQPTVSTAPVVTAVPVVETKSKPQEMAVYWYEQMNAQQRETVTNWAVKNRRATDVEFETTEQAQQMFAYWFNQANEAEKKAIIIELISQ